MNSSPCLHDLKASGIHEPTEFRCGAKEDYAPGWITKPAANAAGSSPKTPAPEFADYEPPSRPERAGHFHHRLLRVSNEAKRGHRDDNVKCCIVEGQSFRFSLDKMQPSSLDFAPGSGSSEHDGICIDCRYACTTPSKFRCNRRIAATDVQEPLTGNWADQLEEELPLERVGNLAKAGRSPPVRTTQSAPPSLARCP